MAKLKKRHRIRRKEINRYSQELSEHFGCPVFSGSEVVDIAESEDHEVILVGSVPVAVMIEGRPILTVKGLMRYKPTRFYVEVDMGAVPFVTKGADVMAPGIVAADEAIKEGDLVWIRDERNKRPLAVGRALISGPEMVSSNKGKAVKSIHYVGDSVWQIEA